MTSEKINGGEVTISGVEPLLALFVCLVSLRAELRARKDTVERAKRLLVENLVTGNVKLPRYVERNHRNGDLSFGVCRDARKRVPLPNDPTTPEFRAAYSAALVDAAAAEVDTGDDCRELEAMHAAQRVAMHRAQRRGTAGSFSE